MLRLFRNKKAQSTAEYAILIALVIGVFSAMQIYLRRGLQSRIKGGTDNIPTRVLNQEKVDQASVSGLFGIKKQYEPYYVRKAGYNMTTESSEGNETGTITEAGGIRALSGATSQRTGFQEIIGAEEDN